VQQFQSLGRQRHRGHGDSGHIGLGPVQFLDQTERNRIAGADENDRNRRGTRRCRKSGLGSPDGGDDGDLSLNKLQSQLWQPIVLKLGPPKLDRQVLSLDKTRLIQAAGEGLRDVLRLTGRPRAQIADRRHGCSRSRWTRTCQGSGAQQFEELSSLHDHGC
jgi:hypothetical protein